MRKFENQIIGGSLNGLFLQTRWAPERTLNLAAVLLLLSLIGCFSRQPIEKTQTYVVCAPEVATLELKMTFDPFITGKPQEASSFFCVDENNGTETTYYGLGAGGGGFVGHLGSREKGLIAGPSGTWSWHSELTTLGLRVHYTSSSRNVGESKDQFKEMFEVPFLENVHKKKEHVEFRGTWRRPTKR